MQTKHTTYRIYTHSHNHKIKLNNETTIRNAHSVHSPFRQERKLQIQRASNFRGTYFAYTTATTMTMAIATVMTAVYSINGE